MQLLHNRYFIATVILALVLFAISIAFFPQWSVSVGTTLVLVGAVAYAAVSFVANCRKAFEVTQSTASPNLTAQAGSPTNYSSTITHGNNNVIIQGVSNRLSLTVQPAKNQKEAELIEIKNWFSRGIALVATSLSVRNSLSTTQRQQMGLPSPSDFSDEQRQQRVDWNSQYQHLSQLARVLDTLPPSMLQKRNPVGIPELEEVDGRKRFVWMPYSLYQLMTAFHERIWYFLLNDGHYPEVLGLEITRSLDLAKDTLLPAAYAKIEQLIDQSERGDPTVMSRPIRDARSLYVGGVAGVAFLLGFAPFINLVFSIYGLLAVIAAILGAGFLIIIRLRQGFATTKIFLELAVIGGFVFTMLYGVMWYFISYLPSQPGAWNFPLLVPTKMPK